MKRLTKKASLTLYHGTNIESLKGIADSGKISPQASKGNWVYNHNDETEDEFEQTKNNFFGFIYLTDSPSIADDFANDLIETSGLSLKDTYSAIRVVLEILIDDESRLYPDDVDCKDCKTWQDSLQKIKQAKYAGDIDVSQILSVTLKNSAGINIKTNLQEWKQDLGI